MKINSIIDLVKDLDTSRQTKNLNKLLIRILLHLQVEFSFFNQELYSNPLERAIYLHCNIAKLQPFIDGNKRTSRMMESIVMMNADLIPVYSAKDADILHYRKGLISFYETGNYSGYTDYFLNRQIERINELSLSGEPTFDLNKNR